MSLIIGPHINRNNSFRTSVESIKESIKNRTLIDITAFAIFVAGPRSYSINITDDDIDYLKNCGLHIFVHNTYLTSPWKGVYKAMESIDLQLSYCDKINAKGFIIHLPKEKDIDNIIDKLHSIIINKEDISKSNTIIYLEIPAISKNSTYHCTDNINELFDKIYKKLDNQMKRFGICVDTAHLWSCGVDVSSYNNTIDWLNELNVPNVMFHLNDNTKSLGKAPDEHIELTAGEIWKSYSGFEKDSGIHAVIKYAQKNEFPIILERKFDYQYNKYEIEECKKGSTKSKQNFFNDYKIINDLIKE
jgi:endonuclease IV